MEEECVLPPEILLRIVQIAHLLDVKETKRKVAGRYYMHNLHDKNYAWELESPVPTHCNCDYCVLHIKEFEIKEFKLCND